VAKQKCDWTEKLQRSTSPSLLHHNFANKSFPSCLPHPVLSLLFIAPSRACYRFHCPRSHSRPEHNSQSESSQAHRTRPTATPPFRRYLASLGAGHSPGISPCRIQFAAMVSTRHHPRQFPEPDLSPSKTPSSRKSTTRSEPASPVLDDEPTTTIAKTPKPRARKSTSATSPLSLTGYAHSPPIPMLAWLVISLPLVAWDTLYVLLRPHTMPGGKFHSPFWTPYALYGTVDYVRSIPLRAYIPYFLSLSATCVSDIGSSLSHRISVLTQPYCPLHS
jgi:hypothetical protein